MSEIRALIEKAARSFDAADRLLEAGDADFAVSRTYYGYFYVAEALLLDEERSVSTHAGVIGDYGRLFATTGRLDSRYHRLLHRAYRARQVADYDTDFDLSDSDVRELLEEDRGFLAAAQDYLGRSSPPDDRTAES